MAMIELIFSIVIMSIVLLSAPMLISTAAKSTPVALQQEGINQVSTRINMILTYNWDENNNNPNCINAPSILVTTNGDAELNVVAGTDRRAGTSGNSSSHIFTCGAVGTINATAGLGKEEVAIDDIDDFQNTTLVDIGDPGEGKDYIENDTIQIATAVNYRSDDADYSSSILTYNFNYESTPGGASNIKSISVTLSSTHTAEELNGKNITMHAFSCNIGGFNYNSRVMP